MALSLLISEPIKIADMKVDQAQVLERFEELAQQFPDARRRCRPYRSNPQIQRQMEAAVLEDQAGRLGCGTRQVTDQPSTFKELMNFGA